MRIRRLGRAIWASLQGDRKRRVETAGQDVETLLGEDPPNPKEAWGRLKGWYKAAVNRSPPPSRATLEQIMAERVDLYSYIPTWGKTSQLPLPRRKLTTRYLWRTRSKTQ